MATSQTATYKGYRFDPSRSALGLVDVQNDFTPPVGTLAVEHGDEVVPPLNRLMVEFLWAFIWASQDWHEPNHCSFHERGGPFPQHCLQCTRGAALRDDLDQSRIALIKRKGMDSNREEFSGLDEGVVALLRALGIDTLFLGGLATDYCVKATALAAKAAGFAVVVVLEACRAVNVNPGDGDRAVEEMRAAGIVCL